MFNLTIEAISPNIAGDFASGRFLQSPLWAQFKSEHGWAPLRFFCKACLQDSADRESLGQQFSFEVSVLVRALSQFGSMAYVPLGIDFKPDFTPELSKTDYLTLLAEFSAGIRPFLPKNIFCIRFDPPLEKSDCVLLKFKKSLTDVQPPDTVLLDLQLSEETLLNEMKSKWRYNIKLAEKKGVTIRKGTLYDLAVFYDLYKETAQRDGIAIHAKKYYYSLLERSNEKNPITLYIAEHEGDTLAAIITLFTPFEAVYLYGASSNTKRNLMSTYLLQWSAIKDAKKFGARTYDFYGIPPDESENHPMHGLYRFKTGFGGTIIHRIGSIDFPFSGVYSLYTIAENLRAFWFKRLKKLFLR